MKICFFTENYYRGGLDTFLVNLFNAWPDPCDRLTLMCNRTHPGLADIAARTRRRICIESYFRVFTSSIAQGQGPQWSRLYPVRAFFVLAFCLLEYPVLFFWYVFTLTLLFRRCGFDRLVVVNGGYPASMLCRCAAVAWNLAGKRPLAVLNFHNSTTRPSWYCSVPEYLIDLAVVRSVREVVSVSKACLDSLETRRAFVGSRKLSYIHNGIEDPLTLPSAYAVARGTPSRRYCLMLATYESRKGHSYLLEAFRMVTDKLPDVELRIHGHGRPHERRRVAEEVKRLNLGQNVILGDFTTQTVALLANASVLVVPSQEHESFGLTIIEAMAMAVPVVATDVGGIPEVMSGCNAGYICSKYAPSEFAAAIHRILEDARLASNLGQNGRKAFEYRFTVSKMAREYEALLNR